MVHEIAGGQSAATFLSSSSHFAFLRVHSRLKNSSLQSPFTPHAAAPSALQNTQPGINVSSMKSAQNHVIHELRKLWPLIQNHGVTNLWVFGSHARGDSRPDSDLDLLVDFASPPGFDNFMGLKFDLEDRLGTKVDLLSRSACGTRFLNAIKPELLHVA